MTKQIDFHVQNMWDVMQFFKRNFFLSCILVYKIYVTFSPLKMNFTLIHFFFQKNFYYFSL